MFGNPRFRFTLTKIGADTDENGVKFCPDNDKTHTYECRISGNVRLFPKLRHPFAMKLGARKVRMKVEDRLARWLPAVAVPRLFSIFQFYNSHLHLRPPFFQICLLDTFGKKPNVNRGYVYLSLVFESEVARMRVRRRSGAFPPGLGRLLASFEGNWILLAKISFEAAGNELWKKPARGPRA